MERKAGRGVSFFLCDKTRGFLFSESEGEKEGQRGCMRHDTDWRGEKSKLQGWKNAHEALYLFSFVT